MRRRVLIVSDSSHKALREEKRLLDRYLLRLSEAVWGGRLSQEGEEEIRNRLLKTRSPYRAVLCLDAATLTPRWHVGRRRTFLPDGRQAVGERAEDLPPEPWPLPARTSREITILSALVHDLGKATNVFQRKLRHASPTSKKPPPPELHRHEILSAHVLLQAASQSSPCQWQNLVSAAAKALLAVRDSASAVHWMTRNLGSSSAVAQAARIVATHHRRASLDIADRPPSFRIPAQRSSSADKPNPETSAEPKPDADAAPGPVGSPWDPSKAGDAWRGRVQHLLDVLKEAHPAAGADLFSHVALVVADHLSSSRPDDRRAELDKQARNVLAKSKDPDGNTCTPKPQTLLGHLQ